MDTKEFSYKPRLMTMFLSTGFFALCLACYVYLAMTNHRGLILDRIFHFSTEEATGFYWLCASLSFVFVAIGLWGVGFSLKSKNALRLSPTELWIPKATIFGKEKTILLADIEKITSQTIKRQIIVTLWCGTRRANLTSSFFLNKNEFDQCIETVAARAKMLRTQA